METHIDRFGRVVIPKAIRQHLGLATGDTLQIEENRNNIVLKIVHHTPTIRTEGGIAVFQGKPTDDIERAIQIEREQRLKKFVE